MSLETVKAYLDISLQRYEEVIPATRDRNSSIRLNIDELIKYSNSIEWIDVCKL